MAWLGMYGMWCFMVWYGILYDMVRYDSTGMVIWVGLVMYGYVRHDIVMVRYVMVWYGMNQVCILPGIL